MCPIGFEVGKPTFEMEEPSLLKIALSSSFVTKESYSVLNQLEKLFGVLAASVTKFLDFLGPL